jgi:hypothetical protein
VLLLRLNAQLRPLLLPHVPVHRPTTLGSPNRQILPLPAVKIKTIINQSNYHIIINLKTLVGKQNFDEGNGECGIFNFKLILYSSLALHGCHHRFRFRFGAGFVFESPLVLAVRKWNRNGKLKLVHLTHWKGATSEDEQGLI